MIHDSEHTPQLAPARCSTCGSLDLHPQYGDRCEDCWILQSAPGRNQAIRVRSAGGGSRVIRETKTR